EINLTHVVAPPCYLSPHFAGLAGRPPRATWRRRRCGARGHGVTPRPRGPAGPTPSLAQRRHTPRTPTRIAAPPRGGTAPCHHPGARSSAPELLRAPRRYRVRR